ncbi:hypothetical protein ACFO0A_12630 [Novosphingobium tardum]|uniref:Uncharacterized protein n=1 Tax=Novosphingobium tardum TaxID=1538021 RepID=A0ABV8RR83_9SPHN
MIAGCGGGGNNGGSMPIAVAPAPSPTPTPTPTPTATPTQYMSTPVPFSLTQDRTFDVFGWDAWPAAPVPSAMSLRWNAAASQYEVLATGYADWGSLKALASGGGKFDVLAPDGSKFPFQMLISAPASGSALPQYLAEARIYADMSAKAYVAFGFATAPGDVPASGTKTCRFGMDEIGDGEITFDSSTGTQSGFVEPFYAMNGEPLPRYPLSQALYSRTAPTQLSATYGTSNDNVLESRFFGPQASEIAVRAKGAVTGIMTGFCSS